MKLPPWWPDWRGETVVVAASGPSQTKDDLDYALSRGAKMIVVNNTWLLAPEAHVLYACDRGWWEHDKPGYGVEARSKFAGLKVSGSYVAGCHKIGRAEVNFWLWTGADIVGGGNSGYQAMCLGVLWGAARVLLTGVDCMGVGRHWHGRHEVPLTQTQAEKLPEWIKAFEKVAPALAEGGVEVVNCSRRSAVRCFKMATITEVL